MQRKKDNYYFETFVKLVDYSCKAAELLNKIMNNYDIKQIKHKMEEMHTIEHTADEERHKMIQKLAREFIAPIEREDIMAMADAIDTVTDTIEDVLMRMYMYNIKSIRKYALDMTEIIVKCCNSLKEALVEFKNYRKSKKLHELIVEINELEEFGDSLYTEAIRDLYTNCTNGKDILAWDTTYHYLEKCCDSCETVAEVMENIVMKNS